MENQVATYRSHLASSLSDGGVGVHGGLVFASDIVDVGCAKLNVSRALVRFRLTIINCSIRRRGIAEVIDAGSLTGGTVE